MPTLLEKRTYEQKRKAVADVQNKLRFSFNAKTWLDVFKLVGLPALLDSTARPTPTELQDFIAFLNARIILKYGRGMDGELIVKDGEYTDALSARESLLARSAVAQALDSHLDKREEKAAQPTVVIESLAPTPPKASFTVKSGAFKFAPKSNKSVVVAGVDYNSPDYLPVGRNQIAELRGFQAEASREIWHKMLMQCQRGLLLSAPTGYGKTYIVASFLKNLERLAYFNRFNTLMYPVMYIVPPAAVEQTKRVFRDEFGLDVENWIYVVNVEQLRSSAGRMFIKERTILIDGEEHIQYDWHEACKPRLIIGDEGQGFKNESIQSSIIQSYCLTRDIMFLMMSATPFTKVCECKTFVLAIGLEIDNPATGTKMLITKDNWSRFASDVASDWGMCNTLPTDNSQAAMKRMMVFLRPYIVEVKGVRLEFKPKNRVEIIAFTTPEQKARYDSAYVKYLEKLTKLEMNTEFGRFEKMVADMKFQQEAENIRVPEFCQRADSNVKAGFSHIIAVNYKQTVIDTVRSLVNDYGYKRWEIAVIWGGGQSGTRLTKAQRKLLDSKAAQDMLKDAGIKLNDIGIDSEQAEKDITWDLQKEEMIRLGLVSQTKRDRQAEIDRFQIGRAKICIFTIRSGGVALSLHHTSRWNNKDVPLAQQRSRRVDIAPCYSAIALAQALGRAPRLTSLSDTEQCMLFYGGTVEEEIAVVVGRKLKCLKQVVAIRDNWEAMIHNPERRKEAIAGPEVESEEDSELGVDIPEGDDEE